MNERRLQEVIENGEWEGWWNKNGTIDWYWDRSDGLTEEQVKMLLGNPGQERRWAVEDSIQEWVINYTWESELELLRQAADLFDLYDLYEDGYVDKDSLDFRKLYDEAMDYIEIDLNVDQLVRQTRGLYLALPLGVV